jgi:predicted dehydrogenase
MSRTPSRRQFIQHTAAGVVGASIATRGNVGAQGANDRIRIGIVGFSERLKDALLPALLQLAPSMNVAVTAVADIWSLRREEGAQWIGEKFGKRPEIARNTDELYDKRSVDAVIIATADFQHALHAIEAMKAGCDLYVEKPLANRMSDARQFLDTARETKKIVQVGTQRRSSVVMQRVRDYLKSGAFGPLVAVDIARNVNQPGRWRRPEVVKTLRQEDTDWQRFLMGRTKDAFDPHKYLEFRLFWPYSSGIPDQWLVHDIDALQFATGLPHPRSVVAQGGVYAWPDGRQNADTMTAVLEYVYPGSNNSAFQVIFSSRMGNSADSREMYYSKGGSLDTRTGNVTADGGLQERYAKDAGLSSVAVKPRKLLEAAPTGPAEVAAANTGADASVVAHFRNWIECLRSRSAPVADPQAAYDHSVAVCMTIEAMHTGRRVTFDPQRRDVLTI